LIIAGSRDTDDIRELIEQRSDFKPLFTHTGFEHLGRQAGAMAPGVVIIDMDMPGIDWASAVAELDKTDARPGVVLIADIVTESDILRAFKEGAGACLPKSSFRTRLIPALESVSRGMIYLSRANAQLIRQHLLTLEQKDAPHPDCSNDGISLLTMREKEVFVLLADGVTIREASEIMCISPKTVETHKSNIMKKLSLKNIADLTKLAIVKGLISL